MKSVPAILVLILALLACGCTTTGTTPDVTTPAVPPVPDLTGTWTGTMNGYDEGIGFNDHANGTIVLNVTSQRDRIFAGRIVIIEDNAPLFTENFTGAIGRNGLTFALVEESGYGLGEILGRDEIEFIYLNDAPPFSISIDSLKRE